VPNYLALQSGTGVVQLQDASGNILLQYDEAEIVGQRKDRRDQYVDPPYVFLKAMTAALIVGLTTYTVQINEPVRVAHQDKTVVTAPDFIQPQKASLIVLTPATYTPALDIVLDDRRSKYVDPPFDYQKARTPGVLSPVFYPPPVSGIQTRTLYDLVTIAIEAPGRKASQIVLVPPGYDATNDIVLRDRRSKEVFPVADHIQARTPGVLSPMFYPPPIAGIQAFSESVFISIEPEFTPGRKASQIVLVPPGYDATNDIVLRDRRSKDTYPTADHIKPQTAALVPVLTAYDPATYNIVLHGRPTTAYPAPDVFQPQLPQPRVVTDFYYHPEVDIVLRDRRDKTITPPLEYGPGQKAALVVGLTLYDVYDPAPDTFLRDRRSKEVFPVADHVQAQKPGVLSPVFYPYVPALDIAQLHDRRSQHVDPVFQYTPSRAPGVLSPMFYSYDATPDVAQLHDRRSQYIDPVFQYAPPRAAGVLAPVFYPYQPELDVAQLKDRRSQYVDPVFQYTPARVAGVLAPTFYPFQPQIEIAPLEDRRSKYVDPAFEFTPRQGAALIVGLTTYAAYDPVPDTFLRDRRSKEVFEGTYGRGRTVQLVSVLTTYVLYDPAPDTFLRDRRSRHVDPPFEYSKAWSAYLITVLRDGGTIPPVVVVDEAPPAKYALPSSGGYKAFQRRLAKHDEDDIIRIIIEAVRVFWRV